MKLHPLALLVTILTLNDISVMAVDQLDERNVKLTHRRLRSVPPRRCTHIYSQKDQKATTQGRNDHSSNVFPPEPANLDL